MTRFARTAACHLLACVRVRLALAERDGSLQWMTCVYFVCARCGQDVRQQLMDEISAFAGVPQYQYPLGPPLYDEGDPSLAHASAKKWTVTDRTREVLWDIFDLDKHNAELYEVLGRDLGWTARKQK